MFWFEVFNYFSNIASCSLQFKDVKGNTKKHNCIVFPWYDVNNSTVKGVKLVKLEVNLSDSSFTIEPRYIMQQCIYLPTYLTTNILPLTAPYRVSQGKQTTGGISQRKTMLRTVGGGNKIITTTYFIHYSYKKLLGLKNCRMQVKCMNLARSRYLFTYTIA